MSETNQAQKPIVERYLKFMNDVSEKHLQAASQKLSTDIDTIINIKLKEINKVVSAGFGISKKAVFMDASEIRKAALDGVTSQKRTPVSPQNTPVEATANPDSYEAIQRAAFKKLEGS